MNWIEEIESICRASCEHMDHSCRESCPCGYCRIQAVIWEAKRDGKV